MDWMNLVRTASDLSGRNGGPLRNITLAELKEHKSQYDCWTVYYGKVYNITQYMHYHPGGVEKIMLGAGKDCTALFNKYHAWINIDNMLAKCLVGNFVGDVPSITEEDEHEEAMENK